MVDAKRNPVALGNQCFQGERDALGGRVERGDLGDRVLAQRVEPQAVGGPCLEHAGEGGRTVLVVLEDADQKRWPRGRAGERGGRLQDRRWRVVGVVEHQQRRSVALAGCGDGLQGDVGELAAARVEDRRPGIAGARPRARRRAVSCRSPRGRRRERRPAVLLLPAPSAPVASPARDRARLAAASHPRAGAVAPAGAPARREPGPGRGSAPGGGAAPARARLRSAPVSARYASR